MVSTPVYLDNHATTPVDPRVLEAMLPFFREAFGNAGSVSHGFGRAAAEAVEVARTQVAEAVGAGPREIIFTSGATESCNLALRGLAERPRRKGNHIVSLATEHKAVLDHLARLARRGCEVTLLPVAPWDSPEAGRIDLDQLRDSLREDTLLVSVMLANNEIGVIQPLAEIVKLCREREIPVHCDATQAVGKLPHTFAALGFDLASFSAHKIYGPKGIGALYLRRGSRLRLEPQIDGGGQEQGLRSGTLNVPGIVGFGAAAALCAAELSEEMERERALRDRLWQGLSENLSGVLLNGPRLEAPDLRLANNLNCTFEYVDGEALMMAMGDLAVSSGSACTSANPEPSHVLRALGRNEDHARGSLRFGLGRFTTAEVIEFAIHRVCEAVARLRKLSSMA